MRWNGVFLLGLGLTALGFVAIVATHVFGPVAPAAASLSVAILACGALVACLGTLLNRPGRSNARAYRRPSRLFDGRSSQKGNAGRYFGQRKDYSALPPMAAKTARRPVEFKEPNADKLYSQAPQKMLSLEGPR